MTLQMTSRTGTATSMDHLIIENVRCFHIRHTSPIAPLTILVGENSSGKSTFLALLRLAWGLASSVDEIAWDYDHPSLDFNEEPFLLGSFDQIATFRAGRGGRARSFTIGMALKATSGSRSGITSDIEVLGRFESRGGQPFLRGSSLSSDRYCLNLDADFEHRSATWKVTTPSGKLEIALDIDDDALFRIRTGALLTYATQPGISNDGTSAKIKGSIINQEDREGVRLLILETERRLGSRPYAFAPTRTRPQRTYDPIKDTATPEGFHIPMVLAGAYFSGDAEWQRLKQALDTFGRSSGLFKRLEVRRLGKKESDPFQLQIGIDGPVVNLMDVGYGVSQVLPIVVDSLRGEPGGTFLLQQPEVHLHPRAQAELGSFLGLLAKDQKKRFVIETHSDYLLDRIRMDVRDGKHVTPGDVSILYFERSAGDVKIHSLTVDNDGNLLNVPSSYRRFFMEEEKRFLGI